MVSVQRTYTSQYVIYKVSYNFIVQNVYSNCKTKIGISVVYCEMWTFRRMRQVFWMKKRTNKETGCEKKTAQVYTNGKDNTLWSC